MNRDTQNLILTYRKRNAENVAKINTLEVENSRLRLLKLPSVEEKLTYEDGFNSRNAEVASMRQRIELLTAELAACKTQELPVKQPKVKKAATKKTETAGEG